MPLYEYTCQGCQERFELLVRSADERLACPTCGSLRLEKQFSVPAAHTSGSSLPMYDAAPRGGSCGLPQCGQGGCQGMK